MNAKARRTDAAWSLLCAAAGVLWVGLARALACALQDVAAQALATAVAAAFAAGMLGFAASGRERPVRAEWAAALGALGLVIALPVWFAGLAQRGRVLASVGGVLLVAAIAALGWALASAREREPASASERPLGRAALGLAAMGLAGACAELLLPRAGTERVLGASALLAATAGLARAQALSTRAAAALAAAAALGWIGQGPRLSAVPEQRAAPSDLRALRADARRAGLALTLRYDGWDGAGRVQAYELRRGGEPTGVGALLRDSARVGALVRAGERAAELCSGTLAGQPWVGAARERVLLAGVGTGLELQCALWASAGRVDVAEESAAQLAAVRRFMGAQRAQLDAIARYYPSSAPAFAARARRGSYDLVLVESAATKHVLPPGVLLGGESLLPTDRGLRTLLPLLSERGALWATLPSEPAALRFAITAEQALAELGARQPVAHVVVYQAGDAFAVGVHRAPLDLSQVLELHRRAKERAPEPERTQLRGLLEQVLRVPLGRPVLRYTPGAAFDNSFGALFASGNRPAPSARRAAYAFDLSVATADRPLFHEATRRERPDTWAESSPYRTLPQLAAAAFAAALLLATLAARRSRPAHALRVGVGRAACGMAQLLAVALALHACALWSGRPEHTAALSLLALPLLALLPAPPAHPASARPWAAAVQALFAAAAIPLAPALVLFAGHRGAALAWALLFAIAAATTAWARRARIQPNAVALALVCAALAMQAGCAEPPNGPPNGPSPPPAGSRLAILPDTQFYACAYREIFASQTEWLAQQPDLAAVLHTGDIVDADVDAQWQVAADSMAALTGTVPYLLTTGNHDLVAGRASQFGRYFNPGELAAFDWEAESRDPARMDNSYAVVQLAGKPWLLLGLEFAPRDAVVDWASEVLSAHAELPALLFTHAYLYSDGTRYDRTRDPPQPFHPDVYGLTPEQGINDGEDLWRKLVEPHENVKLVASGHVLPDGTARAISRRASGSAVHELLANYQMCELCPCSEVQGGGGYLRVLTFDPGGREIGVRTYSPYLDVELTDGDNAFTLSLE